MKETLKEIRKCIKEGKPVPKEIMSTMTGEKYLKLPATVRRYLFSQEILNGLKLKHIEIPELKKIGDGSLFEKLTPADAKKIIIPEPIGKDDVSGKGGSLAEFHVPDLNWRGEGFSFPEGTDLKDFQAVDLNWRGEGLSFPESTNPEALEDLYKTIEDFNAIVNNGQGRKGGKGGR